jgi:hypothetical protein
MNGAGSQAGVSSRAIQAAQQHNLGLVNGFLPPSTRNARRKVAKSISYVCFIIRAWVAWLQRRWVTPNVSQLWRGFAYQFLALSFGIPTSSAF